MEEQKEKEEEKKEETEEEKEEKEVEKEVEEKELSQGVLNCLAIIDGVGGANSCGNSSHSRPLDDDISDEEDREAFAESRVINSRPLPQKRKKTGSKPRRLQSPG